MYKLRLHKLRLYKFVQNNIAGDEITDIKNTINETEIRNALQTTHGNVPKFNLKIYAYVYDQLVYFPRSDVDYETITTNKCSSVNRR